MRLTAPSVLVVVTLALASACGSDDATSTSDEAAPVTEAAAPAEGELGSAAEGEASDGEAAEAAEPTEEPEVAAPAGGGNASLTLSNGESYEFTVLCALEPQDAAGSEILFTATSYDDPGLDITQFGDDGTVTGIASVTVFDGSYETLWDAGSVYDAFGGGLELSLSGSTISGSGSFFPLGDVTQDPVDGTVTANC